MQVSRVERSGGISSNRGVARRFPSTPAHREPDEAAAKHGEQHQSPAVDPAADVRVEGSGYAWGTRSWTEIRECAMPPSGTRHLAGLPCAEAREPQIPRCTDPGW